MEKKKNVLPMNEALVEADNLLVEMIEIIKKNRKEPDMWTGIQLIWSWYGFTSKDKPRSPSPEMKERFKLIEEFLLAKESPVWTLYLQGQDLDKLQSNLFILSFLLKLRIEAREYLHGEFISAIDATKSVEGILKQQDILEKIKNLG